MNTDPVPDIMGRDVGMLGRLEREERLSAAERWYIAGPMRGIPKFNFPAFFEAEALLRQLGMNPINPARHDVEMYPDLRHWPGFKVGDINDSPFDYQAAIAWDLAQIVDPKTTGIALLPGWEASSGASLERQIAMHAGKEVGYVNPAEGWFSTRPHRKVVGLMGYAGAGKDTAAEGLVDKGWTRVAFADALKRVAHHIGWDGRKDAHGRILLQRLGVAVRDFVDGNAWVQAAEQTLAQVEGDVVVTDVRFPNEVEFIRARHGMVVRIDRPGTGPLNGHVSEHAWSEVEPDWVLTNDGDPKALQRKLHNLTLRAA